jgi:tetratricopeptide (TPR) repeat protein
MRMIPALIAILGIAVTPPLLSAATLAPAEVFREASAYVLESRYDDAVKVMDRFIAGHPDEPAGYLLKAVILQYRSTDYDDRSIGAEYDALLRKTEELCRGRLSADKRDLWATYYLSSVQSIRGAREVSHGGYLKGISEGHEGAKGMSSILAKDPNFGDAYLGSGSYLFWKSASAGRLRWLPFIGDDREKGIAEVKKAIEKGLLTGPLTNTVLLGMLLEYDPEAARELGERVTAAYPSCRLFAWQLGEAYKKLGRYDSAVRVFSSLAERYAHDPVDDGSGQIRCWWKLAVLSHDLGRNPECRMYSERIIALGGTGGGANRQRSRIEGARKFCMEMENGTGRTDTRR